MELWAQTKTTASNFRHIPCARRSASARGVAESEQPSDRCCEAGLHKAAVRSSAAKPENYSSSAICDQACLAPLEPESSTCTASCSPKATSSFNLGRYRVPASRRPLYPAIETYSRPGVFVHFAQTRSYSFAASFGILQAPFVAHRSRSRTPPAAANRLEKRNV